MTASPPALDLAAALSLLCEDAFFTIAGSARSMGVIVEGV